VFATSKKGFKAQFTMKVLLEVGLVLIVYGQIYPVLIEPPLKNLTTPGGHGYSDPISAAILNLLPFVIACVIIIGIIGFNAMGSRRV